MAIIEGGVTGKVKQKMGGLVFSTWRGRNVVKNRNYSPRNPNTEKQAAQRSLFSLIVSFLRPFTLSLRVGFRNFNTSVTQFNNAMSLNIKAYKDGNFKDILAARSVLVVSKGNLMQSGKLDVTVLSATEIEVDITNLKENEYNLARVVVYNFNRKTAVELDAKVHADTNYTSVNGAAPYGSVAGDECQIFMFGYDSITGDTMDSISVPWVVV